MINKLASRYFLITSSLYIVFFLSSPNATIENIKMHKCKTNTLKKYKNWLKVSQSRSEPIEILLTFLLLYTRVITGPSAWCESMGIQSLILWKKLLLSWLVSSFVSALKNDNISLSSFQLTLSAKHFTILLSFVFSKNNERWKPFHTFIYVTFVSDFKTLNRCTYFFFVLILIV